MKPESLAAGVHKPSLVPIAQLSKYPSKTITSITGPYIIGNVVEVTDPKRKRLHMKSVLSPGSGSGDEKKAKRVTGTDSSDFISLSDDNDISIGHNKGDKDREIRELKTTVSELKNEISRWKTVAQKLKAAAAK